MSVVSSLNYTTLKQTVHLVSQENNFLKKENAKLQDKVEYLYSGECAQQLAEIKNTVDGWIPQSGSATIAKSDLQKLSSDINAIITQLNK